MLIKEATPKMLVVCITEAMHTCQHAVLPWEAAAQVKVSGKVAMAGRQGQGSSAYVPPVAP